MKKWQKITMGILAVLAILMEFVGPHDEAHAAHWYASIPTYFALLGFLGSMFIIILPKTIYKLILKRKQGYYDE